MIRRMTVQTLSCPQETLEGLLAFRDSLSAFLGDGLRGLYLYGSLANGCYNGKTSDIDVLAVLARPIDADVKARLLLLHRQARVPVDATYVTAEELNVNCFPTPVQCVIRPVKLFRVPDGLIDLLVVRQDVHQNGVRLLGPGVRSTVRPVPWRLLRPCVLQLFPVALERFKNPVLMLCRIVCTLETRRPCSKAQGGRWALANLEAKWHDMISQALHDYELGLKTADLPAEQASAFEAYCRRHVDGQVRKRQNGKRAY